MIRWKDFFYFSKADRIAILLLSILICLALALFIYINSIAEVDPSYLVRSEEITKDFVSFEEQMTDKEIIADDTLPRQNNIEIKKKSKINLPKLTDGQTIDLNAVSIDHMTRIPGIGITFAERIVNYREQLGGYVKLEQLQEIKGITNTRFSKILPYIVIKKKHKGMNLNRVSFEKMLSHPYLDENQVKTIVDLRTRSKIQSIDDLEQTESFAPRDLARLSPYISFE